MVNRERLMRLLTPGMSLRDDKEPRVKTKTMPITRPEDKPPGQVIFVVVSDRENYFICREQGIYAAKSPGVINRLAEGDILIFYIKGVSAFSGIYKVESKPYYSKQSLFQSPFLKHFIDIASIKEEVQVMIATEAAGEGINLQFCHFMINYDIPWNPVRLEQRMGRIHRYGQEHDSLVLNFVAVNTREGRVLQKLYDRLREIRKELGSEQVFDVVGEVFPSNAIERMLRDMYAKLTSLPDIEKRIVECMSADRFRAITESALEGLARRSLNLSALIGKSAEARERRLVSEVIEDFFIGAGPLAGVYVRETNPRSHIFRGGKIPRTLLSISERLEPRFGKLGKEYKNIIFDKKLLVHDTTAEWVTPGHPLFEAVRADVEEQTMEDLHKGCIFYDIHRQQPCHLDLFAASVKDGRGHRLHKRLFVVESRVDGTIMIREPTIFHSLAGAPPGTNLPEPSSTPGRDEVEEALIEKALTPFLEEVMKERELEINRISMHIEISLKELIHRQNLRFKELMEQREKRAMSRFFLRI